MSNSSSAFYGLLISPILICLPIVGICGVRGRFKKRQDFTLYWLGAITIGFLGGICFGVIYLILGLSQTDSDSTHHPTIYMWAVVGGVCALFVFLVCSNIYVMCAWKKHILSEEISSDVVIMPCCPRMNTGNDEMKEQLLTHV